MKVWILSSSEDEYGHLFTEMVFSTKEAANKALYDMPIDGGEYEVEEYEVDGPPSERYQRDLTDALVELRRFAGATPEQFQLEGGWFMRHKERCRNWLIQHGYSYEENDV